MKKEVVGCVRDHSSSAMKNYWTFETDDRTRYSVNVVNTIDELLAIRSRDGDKFKITIEKLN